MTAKEKQIQFIKTFLKPTLKSFNYQTSGQTWWQDKGDFFTLINLQNFSWNNKDSVDFCFNIGIVLKVTMKDLGNKSPTYHNLTVYLREGYYLPPNRSVHEFRNKTGYRVNGQTDFNAFMNELRIDFIDHILPALEELNSIQSCVDNFGDVPFWGEHLKKVLTLPELNLHDRTQTTDLTKPNQFAKG
ncbi:protein of unknown function [Dyadobacter sp. SG02]|uniref:DUF4304 domain-containing protein n=1 Tax=Dyadobacter sp. SG02 TaxID=1855291 RepID=UPI0008BEFD0B|nr:DUF4304 domain-containing protein [Dyadobacter sp. SG02]SEI50902.1 protein of unknown function [Dyadobacter sp. SG02]